MGAGYTLKCNGCGYSYDALVGISFFYLLEQENVHKKMKKGEYGKRFMKDALASPYSSVIYERALFLCKSCGELRTDERIDLVVPENKESGEEYSVLRSKLHRCGKCRHKMLPVSDFEKIKCPQCGKKLVADLCIHWD